MKVLLVGDAHFRLDLPYGSHFEDGRRGEWSEVKQTVIKAANDCDTIVFLGDVLDKRHNHSSVLSELTDFLKTFGDKEIHIISGNHEKFEGSKTALDFLKGINPKWHVYTEPHLVKMPGVNFAMLPYMTNAELGASTNEEGRDMVMSFLRKHEADVMVHHHTMSATKTLGGVTDLFNEVILNKDELRKMYKLVVGGHIHEPSDDGTVYVAGSLFTASAGEHTRRVLKLDVDTMEVESIPLPVRPIYDVRVREQNNMTFAKIPKNAIVKTVVTAREADVEKVREMLAAFDAHVLTEDYPNERAKTHTTHATEDLTIDGLLRQYAKAKDVDETRLLSAFDLIRA